MVNMMINMMINNVTIKTLRIILCQTIENVGIWCYISIFPTDWQSTYLYAKFPNLMWGQPNHKNPIICNILQYTAVVDTGLALLKWASIIHRLLLPRVTSLIGLSSFTSQIVTSFQQSYAYFTTTRHGLLSNLQVHYGKAITMISVFNQNKTFKL